MYSTSQLGKYSLNRRSIPTVLVPAFSQKTPKFIVQTSRGDLNIGGTVWTFPFI
jgi:hypothetical protein